MMKKPGGDVRYKGAWLQYFLRRKKQNPCLRFSKPLNL